MHRKKIVYMLKMGGFRNGTQQELNKMVDMVKFGRDCPDAKNGGQNRSAYLLTLKRECPSYPPPLGLAAPNW